MHNQSNAVIVIFHFTLFNYFHPGAVQQCNVELKIINFTSFLLAV